MSVIAAPPRRVSNRPDYGLDAPGVVRGFLAAGALGVLRPGDRVLIVDIRHTPEYVDELRRQGVEATARRSPLSCLATLFTMGSLRTGTVIAQKR
jgi:hypothetical protein